MGQNNSIAGPTVFLIVAAVKVCLTEGIGVHFQEKFEEVQKVLILTCKIDSGTLPIQFYNHDELLALCWITRPINCTSLLGNRSRISFDPSTKKATLKIWGLNNDVGNWKCSRGGKNGDSSSVLIEGLIEPSGGPIEPSGGLVAPSACNENAKTDETTFLVLFFFVISFLIVWIIIIVIKERMKNNSSSRKFLKCNAKLLSGIKMCCTCIILTTVIIVAYMLDNTTEHKIAGSCLATIFGCCLPVFLQLKPCASQEIKGCCLATFFGCYLPICLPLKPCASVGNDDNNTNHPDDTSPCLSASQVDGQN